MRRILFLFLDGVGLGPPGSSNPLGLHDGPAFHKFAGGQRWSRPFSSHASSHHLARPIDATLGVEGLPQSGTGQASLFTGVNCAEAVGRHFGPFPHSKTHSILDQHNVFRQVAGKSDAAAQSLAFANAFPPQYFNASRRRATVTTYCCEVAGIPLRDRSALQNQEAITADLTGTLWRKHLHLDIPERTPGEAGETLATITQDHRFTLFEYFLTDKVGHRRVDTPPAALLSDLDEFLGTLTNHLDPDRDTLIVTSDHGNLEDMSHTRHTRNAVPLIIQGWAAPFFEDATDLTDVTPGIITALRSDGPTG